MRSWVVLRALTFREKSVAERITDAGVEAFVPMRTVMITHSRKVTWEARPLFSGHVFVNLDPDIDRWHDMQRLPGASNFIRFGLYPSKMPSGSVEAIRSAIDDGVFNDRSPKPLGIGDRVKVASGPFADFIGRIANINPNSRNLVIIELLDKGRLVGGARITSTIDKLVRVI